MRISPQQANYSLVKPEPGDIEMSNMCHSCAAPLDQPEFKGSADHYCKYCSDEKGILKPKDVVQRGIAEWFKMWQPNIDDSTAMERAGIYMQSMPAWAEASI